MKNKLGAWQLKNSQSSNAPRGSSKLGGKEN
jgi:hypothetical protein